MREGRLDSLVLCSHALAVAHAVERVGLGQHLMSNLAERHEIVGGEVIGEQSPSVGRGHDMPLLVGQDHGRVAGIECVQSFGRLVVGVSREPLHDAAVALADLVPACQQQAAPNGAVDVAARPGRPAELWLDGQPAAQRQQAHAGEGAEFVGGVSVLA